jgi:sigma-B regulation protein RsbU (phosphoserine phosphatase)
MWARGQTSERRDAQIAALAAALAVVFAVRLLTDPGPFELLPILVAGMWFGRRGALVCGATAAALLVCATLITPQFEELTLIPRVILYLLTALLVGRLVDERDRQAAQLQALEPIQNVLAPAVPPELPLLDVAVRYQPASPGAGGDFYLIAPGHNNSTVFVIADVVGKGIEAAKRATFVRATLSASAAYTQDPAHLLRMANAELIRQYGASEQFITMLCAVIEPDGSLAWCTAGHPPPVSLANGLPVGRPRVAFPLGIAPELANLDVWRGRMPVSGILLYTDGLTDARPPGGNFEPLGDARLGLFLRELSEPTPEAAVERLAGAAATFARGTLTDDLCLVAVRSKLPPLRTVIPPATTGEAPMASVSPGLDG